MGVLDRLAGLIPVEELSQLEAVVTQTEQVGSANLGVGSVGTGALANGAVTNAKIAASAVGSSQLAANAVTSTAIASGAVGSSQLAASAVTSTALGAGAVTAAALGAGAVTGPKTSALFRRFSGAGHNGAGAATATGFKVGDLLVFALNMTDASDVSGSFEAAITVADQIQQSSASDLSLKTILWVVQQQS